MHKYMVIDMLLCMRTTVDINDELLRAAKAYAAEHNLTMRTLVERALRDALDASRQPRPRAKPQRLPSFTGNGVRHGIDLTDNAGVLDAMDAQP